MNLYDEAMSHADADYQEADRERAYRIREERDEPVYIVKEMMGEHFELFFEVEDARNRDHALDSAF